MANARILKKWHTRYLADFLIECTHDELWEAKLKVLDTESKLDTAVDGFPVAFSEFYVETDGMNLQYCIERVQYTDVPRASSCWWPQDEKIQYFMCYPAQFPQAAIYMAIDFESED